MKKGLLLQYLDAACGPAAPLFSALGHDVSRLIWLQLDPATRCRARRVCTAWFIYVHREWPGRLTIVTRPVLMRHLFPPAADHRARMQRLLHILPSTIHTELTLSGLHEPSLAEAAGAHLLASRSRGLADAERHQAVMLQLERAAVVRAACEAQMAHVWEWALERCAPGELLPKEGRLATQRAAEAFEGWLKRRK
jgi:hypothetical protein